MNEKNKQSLCLFHWFIRSFVLANSLEYLAIVLYKGRHFVAFGNCVFPQISMFKKALKQMQQCPVFSIGAFAHS